MTRRGEAAAALLAAVIAGCAPAPAARSTSPVVAPLEPVPPAAPASAPEPAPAAAPKDPVPAAVERNVSLYEAIAAVEPATPCAQAAATIDRLIGERMEALRTVRVAAQGARRADVDALFTRAAGRLSAALAQIETLSQRCAGEPAVGAALARLAGGGEDQP